MLIPIYKTRKVKRSLVPKIINLGTCIIAIPRADVPIYALALRPDAREKTAENGPGIPRKAEQKPVPAPTGINPHSRILKLRPIGSRV